MLVSRARASVDVDVDVGDARRRRGVGDVEECRALGDVIARETDASRARVARRAIDGGGLKTERRAARRWLVDGWC